MSELKVRPMRRGLWQEQNSLTHTHTHTHSRTLKHSISLSHTLSLSQGAVAGGAEQGRGDSSGPSHQRERFIDNLLVRIHLIIEMIWRTGLAPWEFGSLFFRLPYIYHPSPPITLSHPTSRPSHSPPHTA